MTERAFSDTAAESAHAFRAVLQSMSRPGHVFPVHPDIAVPAPMLPTAAAIALTLCDFQAPLWLSPALRTPAVEHYLRFHTGAPIIDDHGAAAFVFLSAFEPMPDLASFAQGTHEYPDRSATLIIQAERLSSHGDVELTGPGLDRAVTFGASPLGGSFWRQVAENPQRFPVGVDMIFVSAEAIASCPRSSRARIVETV